VKNRCETDGGALSQTAQVNSEDSSQSLSKKKTRSCTSTESEIPVKTAETHTPGIVEIRNTVGEKCKAANLPFELRIKKGEDHGWKTQIEEEADFVTWFDKYLSPQPLRKQKLDR